MIGMGWKTLVFLGHLVVFATFVAPLDAAAAAEAAASAGSVARVFGFQPAGVGRKEEGEWHGQGMK